MTHLTWQNSSTACPLDCGGTVFGQVIQDCEGDYGVIGGVHYFYTVRDWDNSCGCEYTEEVEDAVLNTLTDNYFEEYEP